jgi:predicted RNase H-like HicB family nuclease
MARGTNGTKGRKRARPEARTYQLQVVIEVDEDGRYVAWCPALQACYTQGDTFEEAMRNIREVVAMCLDELQEEKKEIDLRFPEVIGIKQVEVTV